MTLTRFCRATAFLLVSSVLTTPAWAQPATPEVEGLIDDYSAATGGLCHIAGEWSLSVNGNSGKVEPITSATRPSSLRMSSPINPVRFSRATHPIRRTG